MEDILKELSSKKQIIDATMEKYVPRKFTEKNMEFLLGKPAYKYSPEAADAAIAGPFWNILDRGGKRWRPALFLLVYEAFGGKNSKALDLSIIPEVIHNGTLVHDDIEDGSENRRGAPCTHKIYGVDIGINIGDLMYFLPIIALIKNKDKFDEKTIAAAYEVYATEMIRVAFGQATELAWHNGLGNANSVSEEEYLQMCYNKTGALSGMSTKLAAVLAGANGKEVEAAGNFAATIGVAFQIQDDVLNLIGKTETFTGKDILEDITEGKRSLPVVHALKVANESDRNRLTQILGMHTKDPKIMGEAVEILKRYKAVEYSKAVAKRIVEKAWKEFEAVLPETPAKKKLLAFAKFLVEREV